MERLPGAIASSYDHSLAASVELEMVDASRRASVAGGC
jgi:hypothetical protein